MAKRGNNEGSIFQRKDGRKVVQEILGHSSIAMTLDTYSHVLPDTKKV